MESNNQYKNSDKNSVRLLKSERESLDIGSVFVGASHGISVICGLV